MKFVFYTNSVSPHQLPLAREIVKRIGEGNYRYLYTNPLTAERKNLGWQGEAAKWVVWEKDSFELGRMLTDNCECLYNSVRDFDLMQRRARRKKKTIYTSERWFKPLQIFESLKLGGISIAFPGWLRLLHPRYLRYAWRIAQLLRDPGNGFLYYPIGVWARRDMLLICRLFGVNENVAMSKMRVWGDFVASSFSPSPRPFVSSDATIHILWVGRMLYLKRVDTIIRAVHCLDRVKLDVYGTGPMETKWKKLATELLGADLGRGRVAFHGQVPISEVRQLMRKHDVYILASDGREGWGAVVPEALEEGMHVVGTYEAGASATILSDDDLYHAGNVKELVKILYRIQRERENGEVRVNSIGDWSVAKAAEVICKEMN